MATYNRYAREPKSICSSAKDWRTFEEDFLGWAGEARVLSILDGTRARPAEPGDALDAWEADHWSLYNTLRSHLGDNVKRSIISHGDTAPVMWQMLRASFVSVNITTKDYFEQRLKLDVRESTVQWKNGLKVLRTISINTLPLEAIFYR